MVEELQKDEENTQEGWSSVKLIIVALLFLLSGASSLIYQVIWTRQMVFVFGSSTFASATVLSAFMGGLALGSYVAGKFADKLRNPFLLYGLLEGVIGLWALLAPFMFDAALPIYKAFWQSMHLQVLPFSILRFIVVALILLPPTACMGATLPLLSKFVTTSLAVVSNRVGSLYAINTLGAVAGAVAGGFYLIPNFGLSASNLIAAGTNLILAVSVLGLNKTWAAFQAPAGLDSEAQSRSEKIPLSKPALYTMIAFGISGAIAMIYEVAWTRALLLVIGSTTYAFSIMLSTFLIGIFLGSFIAARFSDRLKEPVTWFSVMQIILGTSGIFSVVLFNHLPYLNLVCNAQNIHNPQMGMYIRFGLASAVLVPTTLFLGAIFPLAVKSCTTELERIGSSIGTLYSVNTLGAIIGSFAAGFLIIPALGGEQTLICCAVANWILGAGLLAICSETKQFIKIATGIVGVILIAWAATGPQIWNLHFITASQKLRRGLNYSQKIAVLPFNEWAKVVTKSFEILSWKDGICANVAVVQFPDKQTSLFTNGHIDASDGVTDMSTQVLLPTIPLLLKPNAKDVADVGWGSGCTMGYALLFPVKKMICAEIEPAVVETSKYFHKVNFAPENDTRLKIEYNDGRNYLLATDEQFDVITSEPSNPWQAGVCNLYTQEYFKVCHDRLKPGGIFTMWWQCNEVSSDNLARVFAALKKVFKHVVIFETFVGDIAACCSDEPVKLNLRSIEESLENPRLRNSLQAFAAIQAPEDLALKVCMADDGVDKVIAGLPPNTDDKNHIEFNVAKTYEQQNFSAENRRWLLENAGSFWDVVDWGDMSPKERAMKMAGISERAMVRGSEYASAWAAQSFKTFPNSFALCVQALIDAQKKGDFDSAYSRADYAVKHFAGETKPLCVRGIVSLLGGAPLKARADFETALKAEPNNNVYKYRLAQTYMPELRDWYQIANLPMQDIGKASSDPKKALELLMPIAKDNNFLLQNPTALGTLAAIYLKLDRIDESLVAMQNFLKLRRDDLLGLKLMAQIYTRRNDSMGASYCNQKVAELSKTVALRLCQSAQVLMNNKKEKYALGALARALEYNPGSAEARILLRKLAVTNADAEAVMKQLANFSFEDLQAYKELQQSKAK